MINTLFKYEYLPILTGGIKEYKIPKTVGNSSGIKTEVSVPKIISQFHWLFFNEIINRINNLNNFSRIKRKADEANQKGWQHKDKPCIDQVWFSSGKISVV